MGLSVYVRLVHGDIGNTCPYLSMTGMLCQCSGENAIVASMLPKMGVLKATSVSSNLASGFIEPAFVYSLPIDFKQVATKLWKLWDFYSTTDPTSEERRHAFRYPAS